MTRRDNDTEREPVYRSDAEFHREYLSVVFARADPIWCPDCEKQAEGLRCRDFGGRPLRNRPRFAGVNAGAAKTIRRVSFRLFCCAHAAKPRSTPLPAVHRRGTPC